MTPLTFLLLICSVDAVERVEVYRKGSSSWHCTDTGHYLELCGRSDLPPTVACKMWVSGEGKTHWECSPAHGRGWNLRHVHKCTTEIGGEQCSEQCTLHTIATPQHELHPMVLILGAILVMLMLSCSCMLDSYDGQQVEGSAFWGGYLGANIGSEDDEWGGSSWS